MMAKNQLMSGHPYVLATEENISKIEAAVHANQRLIIRELAGDFNMLYGLVQQILTENLDMHCSNVKFVPQMLTATQKGEHVPIAMEMLDLVKMKADFLASVIMGG